jgi:hypothetical protein
LHPVPLSLAKILDPVIALLSPAAPTAKRTVEFGEALAGG